MTRRRIVIVNDTSVARGGAAALALMSAEDFVARGHEVIWVTGDSGDDPALAALGIEVHALGGKPLLEQSGFGALHDGIRNTAARDMMRRFIATHDTPDTVYHVHAWAQILSPELFAGLRPVSHRTFIHAHDMFLACPNGVYMDYQKDKVCTRVPLSLDCVATHCDKRKYPHKLWRVVRQRALRKHLGDGGDWAGIIALHPEMTSRMTRAGYREDRVIVVRNPVVPFSETRIEAERNRRIVYVGRLEADKGVVSLAQAAERTGVPVTFVGDGTERGAIEAMNADIRVTGWAQRHELGGHVADARALIMPSHHPEPFALVIPEASASGLPVLTAETALMAKEIVANGLGFAFDVFDPESLDRALTDIAGLDDARLRKMSEAGFADTAGLGNRRGQWIDGLEAAYDRVVGPAALRV